MKLDVKNLTTIVLFSRISTSGKTVFDKLGIGKLAIGKLAIGVLCLVVSACGFSPRGSKTGAYTEVAIFVDAQRDVPIATLLRQKITDQELRIAENRDNATILVRLTSESQSQRVLSVQSEGKVSEFELRHATDMLVVKATPGEIATYPDNASPNRVSVVREYTYDDTGVLGKEDEASILRAEMRDELARNLLLRIIASVQ